MKILKCIAVDDEPHALKILQAYVDKIPFLTLENTFQSPLGAIPFLEKKGIDILFLDIQMPELTGLQFLNILKIKPSVILTTAYSEYALDSYEYAVEDYLLKPYSFERFLKAVQKTQANRNKAITEHTTSTPVFETGKPKTIFVKGDAKNKYYQVDISKITYIEGLRNYLAIYQKATKKIVTLQSMKSMEAELPADNFIRIHKSYIINMDHVEMIEGHAVKIGDKRLPIGGSYKDVFFARIEKK